MSNFTSDARRHTRLTRILHAATAIAVIWQLGLSQIMHGPKPDRPDGLPLVLHEYGGSVALGILVLFWINALLRSSGTQFGALFPWFSADRRQAFWEDLKAQASSLAKFSVPRHSQESALASAVHGAGLLLMTAMAGTGVFWWLQGPGPVARLAIEVHELLASLVWIYLISHAAVALLHHIRNEEPLSVMWSLRR